MKTLPLLFILGAILSWGAYVPTIHHGQFAFVPKGPLRAFLFVGIAYFLVAVIVPGFVIYGVKAESATLTGRGVTLSLLAGLFGALGALCVIYALKTGGKPIYVAPLVFAGAPIMNVIVTLIWEKKLAMPDWRFLLGIVLAAVGAALVLRFKPA
ncbi:MAG: hypothetical protein ACE5EQ_01640 [Phycisphaerae bacterium]